MVETKPKVTGARHHLTIAEKNQLRACHRAHPDMTQELLRDWAHSKFGKWVGRSTIGKITSSPDELGVNQDAKRNQTGRFPDMERALYAYVLASTASSASASASGFGARQDAHTVGEQPALSDAALWAKANELLKRMRGEQHSVSVGWVQRFKKRHGLHKGHKRSLHHLPMPGDGTSEPAVETETPLAVEEGAASAVTPLLGAPDGVSVDEDVTSCLSEIPSTGEHPASGTGDHQQAPSEARVTRASVRKQFLAADDILLLTQALLTKPWTLSEPMNGWREVSDALKSLDGFGLEKSAGACQARVNLLVDHARSGNESALRKSGSAEEFQRKKALLAEIVTDMDRVGAASSDARGRKRLASELTALTTEPDRSRRRTTAEDSTSVASTDESAAASGPLVNSDDVMRRVALLETKLELELAVQRRNAEQQVRELGKQYQQQLERHQRQFDQQLASIEQQQVTIIELLKIVVERSAKSTPIRPE